MANEFIVRTGLKVTGSAEISSSLKVADLASASGKVLNIGTGGKLESSGYALNQDLNTTSTVQFAGATVNSLTVNGTASIAYLNTIFESASVIYSSGSNIFGDASNDTQTLYGTINVMTGPTNFTGSVNSQAGYTGSLLGTASYATYALAALSSSFAAAAANATTATTASYATVANSVNQLDQNVTITGSLSQGSLNVSFGLGSHAEGSSTTAVGDFSHSEGEETVAIEYASHAEGLVTTALGVVSHAEGQNTTSKGYASHAEGSATIAEGMSSHAEGQETTAVANYSHTEGLSTTAKGLNSHAEGEGTIAAGDYQHVEGKYNIEDVNALWIVGDGTSNSTRSNLITAYTDRVNITGSLGITQGITGSLLGTASYATVANSVNQLNQNVVITGSLAQGLTLVASGIYSHAEGATNSAIGAYSHAEGTGTTAIGEGSHAEGSLTTAKADYSHAEGRRTITGRLYQTVVGQNNIEDLDAWFVVGDGGSSLSRSNVLGVYTNAVNITGSLNIATGYEITLAGGGIVNATSVGAASFVGQTGNADALFYGTLIGNLVDGTASYASQAATASYVLNAVSSSYALTASYAANVPATASYALQALTASFAQTASSVNTLSQNVVITLPSTQQTTLSKQQSTAVSTITTVNELSVTNVDAVFFDYVIKNSTTDLRAGTVIAVTNGSTVEYTETSTADIGNTSGVTLSVDLNSGNIRLRATATSGTWTVRAFARTI